MAGQVEELVLDLPSMKRDLRTIRGLCRERYLRHCSKWCGEMLLALQDVKEDASQPIGDIETEPGAESESESESELEAAELAHDYLLCGELDRAAHQSGRCVGRRGRFLHLYARYLAAERRRAEDSPDPLTPAQRLKSPELAELRAELQALHARPDADGFVSYLYGVVLRRLELRTPAVEALVRAVTRQPLLWQAWLELAALVTDREMLALLTLPDTWMRQLFYAQVFLDLQLNAEALAIYRGFQQAGLQRAAYISAQIAIGYQNMREVDQAIEVFQGLLKTDPCRMENMDSYSNLLYVKGMQVELCNLAHNLSQINKYSVETCCVIGNYYSLKNQHEKAILYFQRALRLNSSYLAAWTLMGHEYLELKNTNAAIQCYRQAIDVNRLDYRAWYGLGQMYEILKMPLYCQYYYKQAHQLRPNDSRMLMAMGESYEKLDKLQEAKRCYWKAHSIGDIEGFALLRLAKLFERLGQPMRAAAAYADYIRDSEGSDVWDREEQAQAYRFMANYFLVRGQLDETAHHAAKCTEFPETREEGKAILREVAQRRADEGGTAELTEPGTAPPTAPETSGQLAAHGDTPLGMSPLPPFKLLFSP
ncbi:cell division cycle protein 23 homolog [Pollicipes pollicipes]|uniref:cell division cycle protein 23 homolog n=1 Tax=Pollicipes pollicipes TaxID=41117 RepID=UPI001885525A|nr:cell division cycle protein 23 homolog [Pollicipes pollicipes]XP_037074890.1 cell division cycle protein 23 homolog [Pollicipes pollicipes]XP_037074891.1 cell division cycle protein 23 homolog [Pollicipes pollicipes]XP_037074892.1 cell division cycle protein 23 homolog [Pollicipes pollicipes]XP_037074893.1 cell division cycle protein 23 homolog [Pollicipes pollicipes]